MNPSPIKTNPATTLATSFAHLSLKPKQGKATTLQTALRLLVMFVLAMCLVLMAKPTQAQTGQFIIKLKESVELSHAPSVRRLETEGQALSAVMQRNQVDATWLRAGTLGTHIMRWGQSVRPNDADALLNRLRSDPEVEFVQHDRAIRMQATPNDTGFNNQWALRNTSNTAGAKFNLAWDLIRGSSQVVVAVLDSGVIFDTPDLMGRLLSGYDFVADVATANDGNGRDANPADPGNWITQAESQSGPFQGCPVRNSSWHGTFVAGQIAANTDNGLGIAGADWNVKVLPVRVLGKCGGFLSDVLDAMLWSAGLDVPGVPRNSTPANIVNLSLGSSGACSNAEQNTINRVTNAGVLVVVAAGNGGGAAEAPANCNGALAVGALDRDGNRALYSAIGDGVDLMAPGGYRNALLGLGNTGTTGPGTAGYVSKTGTSFAAPLVSAAAALLKAVKPSLSPQQLTDALVNNTAPFLNTSSNACTANNGFATCRCTVGVCGSGMLDAHAAVLSIRGNQPLANAAISANGNGATSALSIPDLSNPVADETSDPTTPLVERMNAANPVLLRGNASSVANGRTVASYRWEQVSGTPLLTSPRDGADVDLPAANTTSDLVFRLTVVDSLGESHSSLAAIRVAANSTDTSLPSSGTSNNTSSTTSPPTTDTGSNTPAPSSSGGGGGGGGGGAINELGLLALLVLMHMLRLGLRKYGVRSKPFQM